MSRTAKDLAAPYAGTMVEHRRTFHANPELSFEEYETARYIRERLTEYGISLKEGIGGNSVVGVLDSGTPGPTIAYRADIDALALQELKDSPYKSKNDGVMHACGHDGHTAILLGFAETLSKNKDIMKGKVVFLFQQAEEKLPGGAKQLCEEGALDGVDMVFGLHVTPLAPTGTVIISSGPRSASTDSMFLTITGSGGHGASPHRAIDPITTGCTIVQELQLITTKYRDPMLPLVVNICKFSSGHGQAVNVIPETAEILGTIRCFNDDLRKLAEDEIKNIIDSVCKMKKCTYELDYQNGYPALINHDKETELVHSAVESLGTYTIIGAPAQMGAEDFSYYLKEKPGCFFNLGVGNQEKGITAANHNPSFDLDEDALLIGLECFLAVYLKAVE